MFSIQANKYMFSVKTKIMNKFKHSIKSNFSENVRSFGSIRAWILMTSMDLKKSVKNTRGFGNPVFTALSQGGRAAIYHLSWISSNSSLSQFKLQLRSTVDLFLSLGLLSISSINITER